MGETIQDRLQLLLTLCRRQPHPESVPINKLTQIPGTPLENQPNISAWDILRLVAVTRIIMPHSMIRLSSGRIDLSYEQQALCFLAGANSIFSGEKLLTVPNPNLDKDEEMFQLLGLKKKKPLCEIKMSLEKRLLTRQMLGNLRQLKLFPSLIDFSSNDYLGLARSVNFVHKVQEECHSLTQLGSTGSRLLTGHSSYVQDLEQYIALQHGFKSGLLFNCGYMANVGLLSSVATHEDVIFFDAHIHASTRDGITLSRAQAFPFRHNDLEHLEKRLKNCTGKASRFLCIESLYSTDGSKAPLTDMAALSKKYDAKLIVDEAHAVGVMGPDGLGLVAEHALQHDTFAQIVTFGKALGVSGAIVLSSDLVRQALVNFATSFIYTTALPFPSLAAIKCSYLCFPFAKKERSYLHSLIRLMQQTLSQASNTHIQAIPVSGNLAVKALSQHLLEAGFDVRPLTSPTVKRGEEVLRICLHSFNTETELSRLLEKVQYAD
ncbi:MAG: aminotransferase class I/II-fold pyridoxal phosphate-dependent enzyme [Verrucomicrobia bacterium]|nr:aminotransferase class I/II-fold pyridoxal phosphate-dependent enzyme [Verrucomicrobiota bacterium]